MHAQTRAPIRSISRRYSFSTCCFQLFQVQNSQVVDGASADLCPSVSAIFFQSNRFGFPSPPLYFVLQGYVHIRTDGKSMVVPIELQVSRGGVDPRPSEVDFGVLTSPLERRQASISLFNR